MTESLVHRILFSNERAIGIEYSRGTQLAKAHAAEVIVSAGTINSPQILELSGIGAADRLLSLGIEPRL